jgi:RNA polymerase subunit RPABC4/transcription elongation factor Spt4
MPQVGLCRVCMKGISATASICPRCHTTTSYGKWRIATRTLRSKLKRIAGWFAPKEMARRERLLQKAWR